MGACTSVPDAPSTPSLSPATSTMRLRIESPAAAASPSTLCDTLLALHGVRVVHTSSPSPCATACVSPRYAVLSPPPLVHALAHEPPVLVVRPPDGASVAAPVAVVRVPTRPGDRASAARTASLPAVAAAAPAPALALRTGFMRTATDTRPLHVSALAVA